jgi:hypothetical protein
MTAPGCGTVEVIPPQHSIKQREKCGLAAVFYGLNNSSINRAGTSSTAQNTTQASPPAAPPGMRDVTPRTNTDQGMTTGAAPARPQTPPSTAPTGSDMNRSGNPPTNTAPSK